MARFTSLLFAMRTSKVATAYKKVTMITSTHILTLSSLRWKGLHFLLSWINKLNRGFFHWHFFTCLPPEKPRDIVHIPSVPQLSAWKDGGYREKGLLLQSFLRRHFSGKPVVVSLNVGFFSGYKNYCAKITFIITKSNSKSWIVTYIVLYPQKEMFKTQLESQNDNREKRKPVTPARKRENEVRWFLFLVHKFRLVTNSVFCQL